MERVGRKVLLAAFASGRGGVGTIVAEEDGICTVDYDGGRTWILARVADTLYFTPRDSFDYRPGDRG